MLSVAPCSATAACAGVFTSPPPACGWSKMPLKKITRRMRPTLSSSVASVMLPAFTSASTLSAVSQPAPLPAACVAGMASQFFIGWPPGISRSMPAFTVGAVE